MNKLGKTQRFTDMKKNAGKRILPLLNKAMPILKATERIARLAVHMQKPTLIGSLGMVAAGATAATEFFNTQAGSPGHTYWTFSTMSSVVDATIACGGRVVKRFLQDDGAPAMTHMSIGPSHYYVNRNGSVSTYDTPECDSAFEEWLRQSIDRALTISVELCRVPGTDKDPNESYETCAIALSQHDNPQAQEIVDATLPLLDDGRCILLDGRPGVGKTTLAQIIARLANLGRTVLIDGNLFSNKSDSMRMLPSNGSCGLGSRALREGLGMLSPGVAIIDDVDKVNLTLPELEAIRSRARLVILTSNNGQYDEVLDGALMRAGRVDEVFSIRPVFVPREAPFDKLDDAEWEEVREWPIAYLTEVKKRLVARPHDLRLEDLRARMLRKTRSGDHLL